MASVPRYNRTERTEALPTPLVDPGIASPDAFGAAVGEGIERGAMGLGVAKRLRERSEEDRADTLALDARNRYISEENQRKSKYFARKQGNVQGLMDEARSDHVKSRDEIAKGMDPITRDKFAQLVNTRFVQTEEDIARHSERELGQFRATTREATIANEHLDALGRGTPEALEKAENRARLMRQDLNDEAGLSGEAADLLHRKDAATLYGAAVDSRIDADDWKTAKVWLDRYGSKLDPVKRTDLERRVREGGRNQEAQDTADTIFRSGYATTKADADRMVSAIPDADLRSRTQTKVDQEWGRRQAALAEARGSTFERIAKAVDAGADVEDLLAKDGDAAALEQADKDALRLVEKRAAARKQVEAGSDEYYLLRNAAAVAPEQFLDTDLRLYRGRISEPERQAMIELQADMRARATGAAGKEKAPRGFLSDEDIANDRLRSLGINPSPEKGEIDPRALAYKRQLDRMIRAAGGSAKVTGEQVEQMADRLIQEEVRQVARSGWNPMRLFSGDTYDQTVRSFEMPGADRRAYSADQIPAADHAQVLDALKRQGIANPTEAQVLGTYNATVGKAE